MKKKNNVEHRRERFTKRNREQLRKDASRLGRSLGVLHVTTLRIIRVVISYSREEVQKRTRKNAIFSPPPPREITRLAPLSSGS